MKELQPNTLYNNKEIAQWFGIKPNSFTNSKEAKLKELSLFADFELRGNKQKKIYIKEVYEPVYNKKGNINQKIVETKLEEYWSQNGKGLDTCKRVAGEMYKDKLLPSLSYKTMINYTQQGKVNKYGVNYLTSGTIGRSIYSWGKYVQDENGVRLVPLTPEEEEIKNKLIKKYFGNTTDKQLFVQGMVENGEITKEQAWEVLEELTNMKEKFRAFKADFEVAINSAIGRGTYLIEEKRESAF